MKYTAQLKRTPSDRRFVYFGLLILANIGITQLSLTGRETTLLFVIGIIGPLVLIWKILDYKIQESDDLLKRDIFPPIPWFFWFVLGSLAIFLRFFHLAELSAWPMTDEAWENYFALNLSKHWDWNLSYCVTDLPPGFFWAQGVFFKIFGVSLLKLWFLPAFFSLIAFFGIATFSRSLFSGSASFILACLAGLSFWPLLIGRISEAGGLCLAWECLCLVFMVFVLQKNTPVWFLVFGIVMGAGFYTYHAWWPAAFVFCSVVFYHQIHHRIQIGKGPLLTRLFLLMVGLTATALPILKALLFHAKSSMLSDLFLFQDLSTFLGHWRSSASYFTILFWGKDLYGNEQPPWYTLLGPIWSAAFFIGLIVILRSRKSPIGWTALGAIPVLASTGLLTLSFDAFRMVCVIPLVLIVATLGLLWILEGWDPIKSRRVFMMMLLLASVYDGSYLWGTYHQEWAEPATQRCRENKSVEYWRAYDLLSAMALTKGPGILLTDLEIFPFDQSLNLMGHSFDWLRNPDIERSIPQWIALFTNPHSIPLLQRKYPQVKPVWLSEGLDRPYGGSSLVILNTVDLKPLDLDRWIKADQGFREITLKMIYQIDKGRGEDVLFDINRCRSLVEGDVFLENVFWMKSVFNQVMVGDAEEALRSARSGLKAGGPNAFFYDQMGQIYWKRSNHKQALDAFQKAMNCSVDLTPAREHFQALKHI